MYGEDVGSLEIHQINNGLPKILLWKQEGNFGNMWHQGFVNTTCNSNTEAYKVIYTVYRLNNIVRYHINCMFKQK